MKEIELFGGDGSEDQGNESGLMFQIGYFAHQKEVVTRFVDPKYMDSPGIFFLMPS